jgi:FHS family L-fucose permease-like MFS transporter
MGETVAQTQPQDERPQDKARFVCRGLTVPFILLAVCFAVWGSAANLTDVMVGVFRHVFFVSNARSALLQTAYYGAYFTLAIPASFINRRFGYKTGVLTGLGVAAVGGLLFFPASKLVAFAPLLGSLFVRQPGCRS